MIDEEHRQQFARLEDKIDKIISKTKVDHKTDSDIASALGLRNTLHDENAKRLEVKVARVEEKMDANAERMEALRDRFDEKTDSLTKLIEQNAKTNEDAVTAQQETNRLLEKKITTVDDFRKKLQYGTMGVLGVIGLIWGVFKLAIMTITGAR